MLFLQDPTPPVHAMSDFKSQVGQDKFVCEFFRYMKKGFFLDIGAYDGVELSNTHYLEKELDWEGICVEADAQLFSSLVKSRDCQCVNAAIYKEDGFVEFWGQGVSGKIAAGGKLVQSLTLKTLLKRTNAPRVIEYISLDIEGGEMDALLGFPFDEYKVILWTIEHNSYEDGGILKAKIRGIMLSHGYEIIREDVANEGVVFEDWYVIKSEKRI